MKMDHNISKISIFDDFKIVIICTTIYDNEIIIILDTVQVLPPGSLVHYTLQVLPLSSLVHYTLTTSHDTYLYSTGPQVSISQCSF